MEITTGSKRMFLAILVLVVFISFSPTISTIIFGRGDVGSQKDPRAIIPTEQSPVAFFPGAIVPPSSTPTLTIQEFEELFTKSGPSTKKIPVAFGEQHNQSTDKSQDISFARLHNSKRANPPTLTWVQAVCKGQRLLALLAGPGVPSPFSTPADLTNNGWTVTAPGDFIPEDLDAPFANLGISDLSPPNNQLFASQDQTFLNANGQVANPTLGRYTNFFNVQSGTIIAEVNFSPAFELGYRGLVADVNTLPPLRQWSDVVWILWAAQAGANVGQLRYIFRYSIVNVDTKFIMDEATGSDPDLFEASFPGYEFQHFANPGNDPDLLAANEVFAALLGTSHGSGIAWVLINHRAVLAGRSILSVRLFTDTEGYMMLWEIG